MNATLAVLQQRVKDLEADLDRETTAHAETRRRLEDHRARLRELALQLCLAEAHERRAIASDLHDHVGQALAIMRIRLGEFRGNAIFSGFNAEIDEMLRLLAQTIAYTRDLTGTISPPVLFELGLEDALDWLAERMQNKRGLHVTFKVSGAARGLRDHQKIMIFRSAQELLHNVVKHADTRQAKMTMIWHPDHMELVVSDRGRGFSEQEGDPRSTAFGLFSIRERMRQLGGSATIASAPGCGTSVSLILPLDGREREQS